MIHIVGIEFCVLGLVRGSYTETHSHITVCDTLHRAPNLKHAHTQTNWLGVDSLGMICHGFTIPEDGVEGFNSRLRSTPLWASLFLVSSPSSSRTHTRAQIFAHAPSPLWVGRPHTHTHTHTHTHACGAVLGNSGIIVTDRGFYCPP